MPSDLVLEGLRRTFGSTVALDDVSLTVRSGTVHTVLGENGSGKSTLVKILSGALVPDRGSVRIHGVPLAPATPRRARALGVATVFQEVLVAPNRSVRENVLLGQDGWARWAATGARRDEIARTALDELAERGPELYTPVGELGLVQQQQVAIARALTTDPKVLVLDESTAAMNIEDRDRLFAAVRRRVAAGMAVVFISHRMDEVLELSDVVTVLRSGRRIASLDRPDVSEDRLLGLLNAEEEAA